MSFSWIQSKVYYQKYIKITFQKVGVVGSIPIQHKKKMENRLSLAGNFKLGGTLFS
jgi:hypothetical protein